VNLTGPFLLAKAAYPRLVRDDGAALLNIISITAKLGASGPRDSRPSPRRAPNYARSSTSTAAGRRGDGIFLLQEDRCVPKSHH
jgi:NAD(P)-dependent dehydrogenase (short-subunit alcohol dehydrogenase family)